MFLVLSLVGAFSVEDVSANGIFIDYIREGTIPEPFYCDLPPNILLSSPQNNGVCLGENVIVSLSASCREDRTYPSKFLPPSLTQIYYKADWQSNQTYLRNYTGGTEFSIELNFTNVPEGNHSITAYAVERRSYETLRKSIGGLSYAIYYRSYDVLGNSTITFVVDTTPPIFTLLSPENRTYDISNVQLVFTFNEPVSKVWYALDGKDRIGIEGNTTLPDLPNGAHKVTVYATSTSPEIWAPQLQ